MFCLASLSVADRTRARRVVTDDRLHPQPNERLAFAATAMTNARTPSSHGSSLGLRRDRGFSLIVALMMLIVIIILGVSASQMAINEERGARNDRDRQIAFQAAEAALKDAEYEIYGTTVAGLRGGRAGNAAAAAARHVHLLQQDNHRFGYAPGCSAPPNAGLCPFVR